MSVAPLRMAALAAALLTVFVASASAQGFSTMLQISPPGGGHCIEVTNGDAVPDQGLQMAECNSSAAQIFIYDPAGMHLTVSRPYLDAKGGKTVNLVHLK